MVAGGGKRSNPADKPLMLDASFSIDQDTNSGLSLAYGWACRMQAPSTNRAFIDCNIPGWNSISSAAVLVVAANTLQLGATYVLTVNCTAVPFDNRSSSQSVTVSPSAPQSVLASISSNSNIRINVNSALRLSGQCIATSRCSMYWSVSTSGIQPILANISTTPLQIDFTLDQINQNITFPLTVLPSSLLPGSSYLFTLTSYPTAYPLLTSYSSVTVTASSWISLSGDYPLQYDFQFQLNPSALPLVIALQGLKTSVTTTLPGGLPQFGNVITLSAGIYSVYGAKVTTTASISVFNAETFSTASLLSYLVNGTASSIGSMDVSMTISTVNNAASFLSQSGCINAPNCTILNRIDCGSGTFAQTCGPSRAGFSGIPGSSNAPCSTPTVFRSANGSCLMNADCIYNFCDDSRCATPSKRCVTGTQGTICSGHGSCEYFDIYGNAASSCLVSDSTCSAKCSCYEGYGSSTCNSSAADATALDSARRSMCASLLDVLQLQDYSSQLLLTLTSSLTSIYDPNEFPSPATVSICLEGLKNISLIAKQGYINDPVVAITIAKAISAFIQTVAFTNSSSHGDVNNSAAVGQLLQSSYGDSISKTVTSMLTGVIASMSDGEAPVEISTDNLRATIRRDLASDLYESTISPPGAGSSYIQFAAHGLDSCEAFSSGYAHLAVVQMLMSPYPNSNALKSPLLRWSSAATGPILRTQGFSSTDVYYFVTTFSYSLNSTYDPDKYGNMTIPSCTTRDDVGAYIPCDCDLDSYTNFSAIFRCPVVTNLCPQTSAPNTASSIHMLDASSPAQAQDLDLREYGILFQSVAADIPSILRRNPFSNGLDSPGFKVVLGMMSFFLLLLIGGIVFFNRWDVLDRQIYFYAPGPHKKVKATKGEIIEYDVLKAARKRFNNAFREGKVVSDSDFMENHVEYQRRNFYIRVASCFLSVFAFSRPKATRKRLSILIGGSWFPRFTRMVAQLHPYLWFFSNRSMQKTRVIRFITTLKSILMTIFISTVFFDVYYPDDGVCDLNYTTQDICLSVPSKILGGLSECIWNTLSRTCSLRPPPSDPIFVIIVSILTTITLAPFDILFYYVLNTLCSRRPNLSLLGLSNFLFLGSEFSSHEMNMVISDAEMENIISEVMRSIHYYEERIANNKCDVREVIRIQRILKVFGLYFNSAGKAQMTLIKRWRHDNIRDCVGVAIKKFYASAERIIVNTSRLHDPLEKEKYLIQQFVLEHYSTFVSKICIRRQFLHYTTELPNPIHPLLWIGAWLFIIGCMLFFFIWILQWGSARGGASVGAWATNFVMSQLYEIFGVSVVRIFIINVLFMEMLRPSLQRIYDKLLEMDRRNFRGSLEAVDTHIARYVSPVCIAASHSSMNSIAIAKIFSSIQDKDASVFNIEMKDVVRPSSLEEWANAEVDDVDENEVLV